jgi:hypothetical protein
LIELRRELPDALLFDVQPGQGELYTRRDGRGML